MDIESVFSAGGVFARKLDGYEFRPEQVQMANAVASSIRSGKKLVVEAGTGTGKTLSYLVPAILSGRQTIISTGTKNLQEQIFFKDIPFLFESLGVDFKAVMMKGRSNYLCPSRLARFSQKPIFKESGEAVLLDKIHSWSRVTETGDKSELEELPENSPLWGQLCSNSDYCAARRCPRSTDCFISRLRKNAADADIVVVNHHLFFADLAIRSRSKNSVLPDYDLVVFDEAHLIEEIAAQYFGFSVSNNRLDELTRDMVREVDSAAAANQKIDKKDFIVDLDAIDTRAKNFFHPWFKQGERRFALADSPADEEASELLINSLIGFGERLGGMNPITDELRMLSHRFSSMGEELGKIVAADDSDYIYWGEARGRGIYLNGSAIDVSETLNELLYSSCNIICTSATLTSGNEFSYFLTRTGIKDADTLLLDSPFDYAKQVIIYTPKMPEPNHPQFVDRLAEEAEQLIKLVGGRTLFLFTSFRNMHEVMKRLAGKLPYKMLSQGEAPRHILLERFRQEVTSVLFATSSFWQGVDVRGESLSCVIIDKLPFASPADPILKARIDRIKGQGGNAFKDYQIPLAALIFKQGLGRLIRHREDRGVIMVGDPRIKTKNYGKTFMKSLPPAPVVDKFSQIKWRS